MYHSCFLPARSSITRAYNAEMAAAEPRGIPYPSGAGF
jgi:hypothetical protein